MYSCDQGLAMKFTLLQGKRPLKLRRIDFLECCKEGRDVYEDELLAEDN